MSKITAAITAVSGYVPEDTLTNADLEKIVDTNDEWITSRTGIKQRHIQRGEGLGTSDMIVPCVNDILKKRGLKPEDIDAVIVATVTPDRVFPSTANIVCDKTGIKNIMSFDIAAACSGFVYALTVGSQFVETGKFKRVIVAGADKMTSIVDYEDRTTCVIFGDGAGAVLLEPNEDGYGLVDSVLKSDGSGREFLYQEAGGSVKPASKETVENREHYVHQEGKTVFKFAVTNMADVSAEIMERNNLTGDSVDWLVPHQANLRIIDATARRMNLDPAKVMINIQKFGNTTSGTIPLCIWEWEKKLKKGDNIVLATFGGGFTWGASYIKWAYDGQS